MIITPQFHFRIQTGGLELCVNHAPLLSFSFTRKLQLKAKRGLSGNEGKCIMTWIVIKAGALMDQIPEAGTRKEGKGREGKWRRRFFCPCTHNWSVEVGLEVSRLSPCKGKPSGLGSASASALFHPQCRCRSRNVAQWSLLTANQDEELSKNWRIACITSTYAGSLLSTTRQRNFVDEITVWGLGFRKNTLYKWTGWRWRLCENHILQMSRLSLWNIWLGLRNYWLRLSNRLSLRSNRSILRLHNKNASIEDPVEFWDITNSCLHFAGNQRM